MNRTCNNKSGHSHDHENKGDLQSEHHGDTLHNHSHDLRSISTKRLWIALIINVVFLILEVIGGLLSNSLALLADAGHMFTDVAALLLAIF
ncbi:unnamed protein product, partial [marine sediment metagenome]